MSMNWLSKVEAGRYDCFKHIHTDNLSVTFYPSIVEVTIKGVEGSMFVENDAALQLCDLFQVYSQLGAETIADMELMLTEFMTSIGA